MPKKVVMNKGASIKALKKIVSTPVFKSPVKTISKTPDIFASKVNTIKKQKVSGENVEKILVENFVSLQKVMVNLSVKVDNLTMQISQLLNLFEITAKSLVEKNTDFGSGYEKRMMEKIDNISDQNKTIARGVTMLHEPREVEQDSQMASLPNQPRNSQPPVSSQNSESYQRSISFKPQGFNKLPQG